MYRAVRALPAGSYCYIDAKGAREPVQYFSIAETLRNGLETAQPGDPETAVHDALLESVKYHMVADVPVGAFLSAGIDSTAVVALARESGASDLQTMTLRFAEYQGRINDEAPLAAKVAAQYGVRHTIRDLTHDEFKRELPRVFDAMDQPTVDGLNSYFISKAAAEIGLKVALSGTGGDELFGGYTSFRDIPRWIPLTSLLARIPHLGDAVAGANRALSRRSRLISPKMGEIVRHGATYAGAYLVKRGRFVASELPSLVGPDVAREGLERLGFLALIEKAITPDPGTPYARVVAMESSFYLRNQLLRDMDWASMAHSLEVRVPLVDAHLLQRLAPLLVPSRAPPARRSHSRCAGGGRRGSRCRSMNGCAKKDASSMENGVGRGACTASYFREIADIGELRSVAVAKYPRYAHSMLLLDGRPRARRGLNRR